MNDLTPCSVLLIEDDPILRRSISLYLEDKGHTVVEADNGVIAMELFRQCQPDIILTDLMMPGMDGLAIVKAVKELAADLPVIVISGNGSVSYAIETMRQGAWDYITKPIHDFNQLDQVMLQSLQRAAEMKEAQSKRLELALHSVDLAEQLSSLKQVDPLTGLPQRHRLEELFLQVLGQAVQIAPLQLLLVDPDSLKTINKSLGLQVGDELIAQVAGRLKTLKDDKTVVCRLGGDQFVIMSNDDQSMHDLIDAVFSLFDEPFALGGMLYQVTAGIGVVSYPQDGESLDRLLQNANIAMAMAKKLGKNRYCFYHQELGNKAHNRLVLEARMQTALKRHEFQLYYQPKVHAKNHSLSGMEALIRWCQNEQDFVVGPDEFIPILEESGLIVEVGHWIIATACAQYMAWRLLGMPAVTLSVNISAVQMQDGTLPSQIIKILSETGMDPGCLCLELTESILLEDNEVMNSGLRQLADLGIKLSIDDFGTGYSSLSYLLKMPIHELKVDRTFVTQLPNNRHSVAIADSILSLARSMDVTVVAEGVELEEQAQFLHERGCQTLQGYLFGKPLPADTFLKRFIC